MKASKSVVSITKKNILATPYDNYWPALEPDNENMVTELLSNLLPAAAIPKGYFPAKKLSKIYSEKSKVKRREMWKKKRSPLSEEELEKAKGHRKSLIMGVNSVARGLEKSQVAVCLVDGSVLPRLIVSHIVVSAACKGIPVLVVPSLKTTTKSSLCTPCLALALRINVGKDKSNVFHPLYKLILQLSKLFPVPDHLTGLQNGHCNDLVQSDDDSVSLPVPESSKKRSSEKRPSSPFKYLHRTSHIIREFIPQTSDSKLVSSSADFIQLDVDSTSDDEPVAAEAQSYDVQKMKFAQAKFLDLIGVYGKRLITPPVIRALKPTRLKKTQLKKVNKPKESKEMKAN